MGNMFVYPSPKSSYEYIKDDPTLIFVPYKIDNAFCGTLSCTEGRKSSAKIPCRFIPCQTRSSPYLIIFFHGNSEDIGFSLSYLLSLFSERFAMNVLCPEYPGYGIYKKKDESLRMDEAIMDDASRVIKYCHTHMRFKYENIILIGRSLGTSVAVQLAADFNVRGIVLISPFTSIRSVAKNLVGNMLSKVVPDVFRSIDYIDRVKCPMLIIHGEEDALIPYEMAVELYDKAVATKVLRLNEEMTHNQFKMDADVFIPVQNFMIEKLDLKSYLFLQTMENIIESLEDEEEITLGKKDEEAIQREETGIES